MAKYDVKYKCGHEGTVELFGNQDERYRKIEWMEHNMLCPACYKAHLNDIKANAEKEVLCRWEAPSHNVLDIYFIILVACNTADQAVFEGRGYKKAAYYTYGHQHIAIDEYKYYKLFSQKDYLQDGTIPLLYKKIVINANIVDDIKKEQQKIEEMGYKNIDKENWETAKIEELLKTYEKEIKAADENELEHEKLNPKPNSNCFDFMKEKHGENYKNSWNGKIYGRRGDYNYYIKGINYSCTDEQRDAIIDYQKAFEKWREKEEELIRRNKIRNYDINELYEICRFYNKK